jgi:thioredoxin 1
MGSAIKDVTDASFQADVLQAPGPVVVYFWSRQSGDRLGLAQGEVPGDYNPQATIVRLNVDQNPQTWNTYRETDDRTYDVPDLPVLMMFKQGKPAAAQGQPMPLLIPQALLDMFIGRNI